MDDLTVTAHTIYTIIGCLAGLVTGATTISKVLKPYNDLKVAVAKHEQLIQDMQSKTEELAESVNEIEKSNKIICKSLLVIMGHEITGNSVDKLKAQREVLEQYLIDN